MASAAPRADLLLTPPPSLALAATGLGMLLGSLARNSKEAENLAARCADPRRLCLFLPADLPGRGKARSCGPGRI